MDEIKELLATWTGKVVAGVTIILIAFLGTMTVKGMNSDIDKRVSANELNIKTNSEDIKEIKGDVLKAIEKLSTKVDKLSTCQTEMKSDISYLRGEAKGKEEVNKK